MKTLIKNEFFYYKKNKTKLILSILFVISFFIMLFVYDNMELNAISKKASTFRNYSRNVQFHVLDIDYDIYDKYYHYLYNPNFKEEMSEEELTLIKKLNHLDEIQMELSELFTNYATLYSGGRMNLELTPYRNLISENVLKYYAAVESIVENDKAYILEDYSDIDLVNIEYKKYEKLLDSETPDNFNYYSITMMNYPSKVFEGYMLLIILVFMLLLFYDLFSKDFETLTYKTIYTTPYDRNTIIKSKIIFAFLYTLLLLLIGISSVSIYLLLYKRVGYNVLASRVGYIFHPEIININPLSIITNKPIYILIPIIFKNIISIILGVSIILFWLLLILNISLKIKASNSTITILTFVLIMIFFVSNFNVTKHLKLIFPLFAYNFDENIIGTQAINMYYIFILTNTLNYILYKYINTDISNIDLLDGEYNA